MLKQRDEKFILAYSDNPDGLLHKFGTTSQEASSFVKETEIKIKEMCEKLGEDTIVIISADHGHKDIDKAYTILDYPEIQECLILPASLESRALAFWVKEDMKKEFEERFKKAFGDEFLLMTKEEFLNQNLLGYGEKHPKIDDKRGRFCFVPLAKKDIWDRVPFVRFFLFGAFGTGSLFAFFSFLPRNLQNAGKYGKIEVYEVF